MIIYATKKTFERYKLKHPQELSITDNFISQSIIEKERGDKLLEWGAKVFYFDRKKCIQLVNFASKFTIFLVDVRVSDIENILNLMAYYLLELYKDDEQMVKAISKMLVSNPITCFDKLTDKSAIATLNTTQSIFADDGNVFYEYIREGVLHTLEINRIVNFEYLFTMKVNKKIEYFYAADKFKELVIAKYL